MANQGHLDLLKRAIGPGYPVELWNQWRAANPGLQPDLSGARLEGAYLVNVNLSGANFSGAELMGARISRGSVIANAVGTNFSGAILVKADLSWSSLMGANFTGAIMLEADLSGSNLRGATLSGADLTRAKLVETNLTQAVLTDCQIYGISAWDVNLEGTTQRNLIVAPTPKQAFVVDQLETAQFIYLLLKSPNKRNVIDEVVRKAQELEKR